LVDRYYSSRYALHFLNCPERCSWKKEKIVVRKNNIKNEEFFFPFSPCLFITDGVFICIYILICGIM